MSSRDAPFIPRRPKDFGPHSFWGLRSQGLAAAQGLAGARWTDYNLHDPGVTILEQAAYALTDLVYRADARVADQLADEHGRIAFEALALHPAEVVFPCRPTTADDYRRMLLDRFEELADAKLAPAEPGADRRAGTWHVELLVSPTRQHRRDEAARAAMALLRSQRNLGEDFEREPLLVQDHHCELAGVIEIGGPDDPADVMAAIYAYAAQVIEAPARFSSLTALQDEGWALEDIFNGPPVRWGLLRDSGDEDPANPVFVADLVTGIQALPGVVQVKQLTLVREGDEAAHASLPRRGPGWALRLAIPRDGDELPELRLTRRGATLHPSMAAVRRKYAERMAAARQSQRQADGTGFVPERPVARALTGGPYCPIQDQFPAVYGINAYGLPPDASVADRASALQLKAYLVLFDQVLAHSATQLAHLRDLFAVDSGTRQTYWWQMLDNSAIPRIEQDLYDAPPAHIEQRVYRPMDDFIERKGRLLDYLLALHGETYSQNSLRQFGGYYTGRELKELLFENKLAFLKDVVALGRDRGAGFDDTQPCWEQAGNTSGLQRRVALLLGFRDSRTRALTAAIGQRRLELVQESGERPPADGEPQPPEGARRIELLDESYRTTREQANADLSAIAPLAQQRITGALLQIGAHAGCYWLAGRTLYAGPDDAGRWHELGTFAGEDAAVRSATTLRRFMLRLNEQSEGLHVIEHVLLAPAGASAAHDRVRQEHGADAVDFSQPRVSVVFPRWPERCGSANFRSLAAETVRVNCPAHLKPRCLWLDFGAMREFEGHYEKWLNARREWLTASEPEQARVRMNHAAAALLRMLAAAPGEEGAS
jgi:hypothetical protein